MTDNTIDVRDVVSVEDGKSGFVVTLWTDDGTGHPLHTFRYEHQARQMEAVLQRVLATFDGFADPHFDAVLASLREHAAKPCTNCGVPVTEDSTGYVREPDGTLHTCKS